MSSKVVIVGIGATGKTVSHILPKYDVFIVGAGTDYGHGSHISDLLSKSDFSTFYRAYDFGDERLERRGIKAFKHSASCALLFGPDAQSPFVSERLRWAIRDRVERTRGEFRVIPVLLPGASKWLKSKSVVDEMCGFKTKRAVRFGEGRDEKKSLHQLILAIRGVGPRQPVDWGQSADWKYGWFRQLVRWRAGNALNVDWATLTEEARDPVADTFTGGYKNWFSLDASIKGRSALPRAPRRDRFLPASPYHWFAYQQPNVSLPAGHFLLSGAAEPKLYLSYTSRNSMRQFDGRAARYCSGIFLALKECVDTLLHKFGLGPRTQQANLDFVSSETKAWLNIVINGRELSEASVGKGLRFHQNSLDYGERSPTLHFRYTRELEARRRMIAVDHYKLRSSAGKASTVSITSWYRSFLADYFKRLWEVSDHDLWETRDAGKFSTFSRLGVKEFGKLLLHEPPEDSWLLIVPFLNADSARPSDRVNVIQDFELYNASHWLPDVRLSRVFVFTSGFDSYSQDLIANKFGCKLVQLLVPNGLAVEEDVAWNYHLLGAYGTQLSALTQFYGPRPDAGECRQPRLWTPAETRDEGCGRSDEERDTEDSEGFEGQMCQLPKAGFFLYTLQPPA